MAEENSASSSVFCMDFNMIDFKSSSENISRCDSEITEHCIDITEQYSEISEQCSEIMEQCSEITEQCTFTDSASTNIEACDSEPIRSYDNDPSDITIQNCLKTLKINYPQLFIDDITEEFSAALQSYVSLHEKLGKHKGLKFIHLNVRSLLPKIDEIRFLVHSADLDVVCINESWLDDSVNNNEIAIVGYNVIRNDRNRHGGGVIMYIKETISYICRSDLQNQTVEAVWIELAAQSTNPVLCCSVYRPPSAGIDYYETLLDMLDKVTDEKKEFVLLGDLNFNYIIDETLCDNPVHHIETLYTAQQMVTDPTRVTTKSSTLLDVILSTIPCRHNVTCVRKTAISDHYLVCTVIDIGECKRKSNVHKYIRYRDYKVFEVHKFLEDVDKSSILTKITDHVDACSAWSHWKKEYTRICDKHAPFRISRLKDRYNPWITREIITLMYKRDHLHSKAIKLNDDELLSQYRSVRNEVKKKILTAKSEYYATLEFECNKNPKKLWKHLNKLAPCTQSVTAQSDITANEFNEYFSKIGLETAASLDNTTCDHDWKNPPSIYKFTYKKVEHETMIKLLKTLSLESSIDVLGFDCKLLRLSAEVIGPNLSHILNLSLNSGDIPDDWKLARVTPVYKGRGDINVKLNYRPISVICHIAKLVEKEVQTQFLAYLIEHDFLCLDQSAYRKYHSTQTSLHNTVDEWLQNIDDLLATAVCFLDISKCFDTIDHKILLKKLSGYGVENMEVRWFTSYLKDRRQMVNYNNEVSQPYVIPIGVPQGSTLGPILFLLYINDLPQYVHNGQLSMFADDTVIYCTGKTVYEAQCNLQKSLDKVEDWYDKNKLKLNSSKSNSMLIASSSKFNNSDKQSLVLMLKDEAVQLKRETKYLGVYLDDELKWNRHVIEVSGRLTKLVGWLCRLSKYLSLSLLQLVYKTRLLPIIDYACSVWGNSTAKNLYMIQRLQNRAARAVCKNFDYINVRGIDLVRSLGWMTVTQRVEYFTVIQMFKCIHGLAPPYLCNSIIMACEVHPCNTRNSSSMNVAVPFARTKMFEKSFLYQGAVKWNKLPEHLKVISTLDRFKNELKHYLLQ